MSFWTLDRIGQALAAAPAGAPRAAVPRGREPLGSVSTDTRSIRRGDVFVALRGERFDAHEFLAEAVARGAAAVVVADPRRAAGLSRPVFVASDTTAALGALGAYRRRAWGGSVIAVAGSNGKTTTKELVRAALAGVFTVHATPGNLNNQVGVPLTLLAIPDEADVAVVEIGTNLPGEVEILRRLTAPDVAMVTSIGEEHLEGLGDLAGVLREEGAVFRDVPLAITPASQPEVGEVARTLAGQTIEAGLDAGSVQPDRWGIGDDGRGWAVFGDVRLEPALRGAHNLRNAVMAMAAARACGVPAEIAARGIATVEPLDMRGAWQSIGSLALINDAYNANPASMREAIALLDAIAADRPRVLVLGGMRELGQRSAVLHEEIARRAVTSRADIVAGIGDFAAPLRACAGESDRVITAPDVAELWAELEPRLPRNALVMLKASRGVRLERLIPLLADWAAPATAPRAPAGDAR
jgi:UDP-N-acetylmuramoyl-tripeptide--D-alanyl-D-alanine ligase